MKYGVTLPLSGIDGNVGRLVEFAHIAEEEGWEAGTGAYRDICRSRSHLVV